MTRPLQVVLALVGAFFGLQGLVWLVRPAQAAEGLGMPLLEGVGRSSQVGDFAAFFLVLSGAILVGTFRQNRTWLQAGAALLGVAAVARTVAFAAHGAAFATAFVAVELVGAGLLLFAASRLESGA